MLLPSLVSQLITARSAPAWVPQSDLPENKGGRPFNMNSRRQRILALIESSECALTIAEIAKEAGEPSASVSNTVSELRIEGFLKRAGMTRIGANVFALYCGVDHKLNDADCARLHRDSRDVILEMLASGKQTAAAIMQATGMTDKSTCKKLREMRESGEIDFEEDHSGRRRIWRLAR